jgi:hypothetical protein
MGKGGTKFESAPIGCRGGGPRGLTGKEARENMRIFQETGHHPELERSVEAERGAYDDAAKLPQRNAHRPHVFMSIEIGAGEVGAYFSTLVTQCYVEAVEAISFGICWSVS